MNGPWAILQFRDGWILRATVTGGCFLSPSDRLQDKSPSFLRCRGLIGHGGDAQDKARLAQVEEWLADSANDCLRARGDCRWHGACHAANILRASIEQHRYMVA